MYLILNFIDLIDILLNDRRFNFPSCNRWTCILKKMFFDNTWRLVLYLVADWDVSSSSFSTKNS